MAGVDSSTQSTKVQLRDLSSGDLLGMGRAPHPTTTPPRSEQDPRAWWRALVASFREALATCADEIEVRAVSVAGQQHGMVILDQAGEVIRPAKLWNDTESAAESSDLVAGRARWWAEAVGSVPVASFTVTKLLWLCHNEPLSYERIARVLLPHDWLTYQLTGQFVTDRGDASGTGYWSPTEGEWRADLLTRCLPRRSAQDWSRALPEVLGATEAAGPIRPEAADELCLSHEVIIGPGTGDNMAAALGIGLGNGDTAVSIGTSGTVFSVRDHPVADGSGCVAGFADATGRFLPLVCTLNATLVTEAIARLVGVDVLDLDELASTEPAGARGMVLVPYLAGERTPNRPHSTGTLTGIRTDVSRSQLARAAFEGVVCGLLDGLDALEAVTGKATGRTFVVGGGARSLTYTQLLADLSNRRVTVPAEDEIVAFGACVQAAAVAAGADLELVAKGWGAGSGPVLEPDPNVDRDTIRATYTRARGIQT